MNNNRCYQFNIRQREFANNIINNDVDDDDDILVIIEERRTAKCSGYRGGGCSTCTIIKNGERPRKMGGKKK